MSWIPAAQMFNELKTRPIESVVELWYLRTLNIEVLLFFTSVAHGVFMAATFFSLLHYIK